MDGSASFFVSDNPFLIPGKNRGSAAGEVIAQPHIDWRMTQRTTAELQGAVGFRQYHRLYGDFVSGLADLRLEHRHNEYLTVNGRAGFERDLVTDTLTDTPDFTSDTLGARESLYTSGTATWTPNSRFTVVGDLGWRKQSYPDSALLETSKALDFTLSGSRRVSENTTVGLQGRISSNRTGLGGDTSVKSLNLIASRRFSEYWRGDVQLGVEWSKADGSLTRTGETRTNFNGSANLCHENPQTTICLRAAARSEVSSLGELQREIFLSNTIRQRISEAGALVTEVNYRRARLPRFTSPARNFRASAIYEHRLARTLYLTPGVAYLQRNRLPGEAANTFIFQIGLSIRGERR